MIRRLIGTTGAAFLGVAAVTSFLIAPHMAVSGIVGGAFSTYYVLLGTLFGVVAITQFSPMALGLRTTFLERVCG